MQNLCQSTYFLVDREKDYYPKRVVDSRTGEDLKEQEEPLSQHASDQEKKGGRTLIEPLVLTYRRFDYGKYLSLGYS